jgi:hypothetical protein
MREKNRIKKAALAALTVYLEKKNLELWDDD